MFCMGVYSVLKKTALQEKSIGFEDIQARRVKNEIFKHSHLKH